MKPHPPSNLLGPGQAWTVVQAVGWMVTDDGYCTFRDFGTNGDFCRRHAVIFLMKDGPKARDEFLCVEHMGSHRWIDEGTVMQWRADPPWKYKAPLPALPPRQRKKDNHA